MPPSLHSATDAPAATREMDPDFVIALGKVGSSARIGVGCMLTAAQTVALADWQRRAWQETHTPYQVLWRTRALAAEARVKRLLASLDEMHRKAAAMVLGVKGKVLSGECSVLRPNRADSGPSAEASGN